VPERTYLITPGPTPVPPEVAAAMARPLIHHRSPDFKLLLEQTLAQLRRAFATEQEVLLFAGSGTSAMESAMANLLSPGDDILVASAGNFGDRWTKIARAYGIEPRIHAQPWGEALDPAAVAAQAQGAVAVYITHSETSTGVVHDVRAIAEALRPAGALLVVDAVSSLGGVELAMDEWGVDVVVSGSQKALMTPPGLSLTCENSTNNGGGNAGNGDGNQKEQLPQRKKAGTRLDLRFPITGVQEMARGRSFSGIGIGFRCLCHTTLPTHVMRLMASRPYPPSKR